MSDPWVRRVAAVAVALASVATVGVLQASSAQALAPVNPVRVDLAGHPANSGFLVFVEGYVAFNADESEGTVAVGGELSFNSTYNVAAHTPKEATFTAPGDAAPTYLYVAGGVDWNGSQVLRVLNSGYSKIADSSTYTALNKDQNGASVNYRIVRPGAAYDSTPRVEGTVNQPPASVAAAVPSSLIDVPAAFTVYRQITGQLAGCPTNAALTDPNGGGAPVTQPYPPGASGRLALTPGQTNVVQMSTADLANLSQITFTDQPTASTPLVLNVTGSGFTGHMPNLAGVSGTQAPYILWNFPQASTITVTGGATAEGTIYAPNAALNWRPTQNIEGNVIAASFTHGPTSVSGSAGLPRELHDFPFATTVSCSTVAPTGTLTLVKDVVNTGGGSATPSDWTLTAQGPQTVSGPGNSAAVTDVTVNAGDYVLTESGGLPNYRPGPWACTGGDLLGNTVAVPAGAHVICTVSNTYEAPPPQAGTLTLVKRVDNTGGGQATPDLWTLNAVGPQTVSGPGNSPQVTNVRVATGSYQLTETDGPADYDPSSWTCTGGPVVGAAVTVAVNADVTCEIANTYAPAPSPPAGSLTLIKQVAGGTATPDQWELTAAGPQTITGPGNSESVTGIVVPVGAYTLSESGGPGGYLASHWTCTGGTVSGRQVEVAQNALVLCSITNSLAAPPASTPPASTSRSPGPAATSPRTDGAEPMLAGTGRSLIPPLSLGLGLVAIGALLLAASSQTRRKRSH